ncbi:hypothetical protein NQ318_021294 [Aromia moschata]|uniref:BRCT domain-containing protein n=1 Tax=Aromia moschata TaxID=1265417 RepID=A0AAV8ZE93_9CUCU|nr:hypothetical protein NQ318_021294 [Aromia moschata]
MKRRRMIIILGSRYRKKRKKGSVENVKKEEKESLKRRSGDSSRENKKTLTKQDKNEKENPNKDKSDKESTEGEIVNNNTIEIKEPIPDYFTGVKALLEDELKTEEHSETIRYFIAHGGTIIKADQLEDATHVLHYYNVIREPTIECPYGAKHLAIEWVKDTISKGSVQDFRCYVVKWDPEI